MPWEKQFDKQEVLKKATEAFWTYGYDATSLCDLLEAMGIQKGSFYATFSSKHELLIDCLESYMTMQRSRLQSLLESDSPREALEKHFDWIAERSSGPEHDAGCFIMNATLELAPRDEKVRELSQKALNCQTDIYRDVIVKAQSMGEISRTINAESASRALVSFAIGMQTMGRASMPKPAIDSIKDEAIRLLRSS